MLHGSKHCDSTTANVNAFVDEVGTVVVGTMGGVVAGEVEGGRLVVGGAVKGDVVAGSATDVVGESATVVDVDVVLVVVLSTVVDEATVTGGTVDPGNVLLLRGIDVDTVVNPCASTASVPASGVERSRANTPAAIASPPTPATNNRLRRTGRRARYRPHAGDKLLARSEGGRRPASSRRVAT